MTETPYNFVNDGRFNALQQWLHDNDIAFDRLTVASADAGFRRYFRLYKDNYTYIAVDAPPEFEDTGAFLDIATRLNNSGLHAPAIHCYSLEKGFLLIEDLGRIHFQNAVDSIGQNKQADSPAIAKMYKNAMRKIIQMQQSTDTGGLPCYDRDFLTSELQLFTTWYLEKHLNATINDTQMDVIDNTFTKLVDSALEQPRAFVHRDFHCRNLMQLENEDIGIIDFQGAMTGPITYDPVSLLKDAYIDWPASFQQPLISQHIGALSDPVERPVYQRWFDFMGLQRHLKILGIFCRLKYRDNKPAYVDNLASVRKHIEDTLAGYRELSDFTNLLYTLHKDSQRDGHRK